MASIRTYECNFIEEYCVAPAPSRDYYGLKVTDTQVLLYVWRVTRGSGGIPIVRREALTDFAKNPSIQNEISRIFGDAIAAYAVEIARGERNYLPHLPQGILHRILLYVDVGDIARIAQVCSKLKQAASSNSLWQMLYQKHNSTVCPTPEQKKRAALVGWKRLFRSTFKYPFKCSISPSSHREDFAHTRTSSSSEVVRRAGRKISSIGGKTSRSTVQSRVAENATDETVHQVSKFRGHTQAEGRQSYISSKLKEIAHKDRMPAVEVLYAATICTGNAEEGQRADEAVALDRASTIATKFDEGQHIAYPCVPTKQDVTGVHDKTGNILGTVDSRSSTMKGDKVGNNAGKLNHAVTNIGEENKTVERDKTPRTRNEEVWPHLHAAKSKTKSTPRKESKSILLEESDTVPNSPRKSSKTNQTVGGKKTNPLTNKDTPRVLTDRGRSPSSKHAGTKSKPASIISDRNSACTTASSSRKSSRPYAVQTTRDKMPSTSRKESKPSVTTELDNGKQATTHKKIPSSFSECQRDNNTSFKIPSSSRKSSKSTSHSDGKNKAVSEKAKDSEKIPSSFSECQRDNNTSFKIPSSSRKSSKSTSHSDGKNKAVSEKAKDSVSKRQIKK